MFVTLHFCIAKWESASRIGTSNYSASFFSFHPTTTGILPAAAVQFSFTSVIASCDKIMFIIIINKSLFNVHRPCYKKVIVQIKITDSSNLCVFLSLQFAVSYWPGLTISIKNQKHYIGVCAKSLVCKSQHGARSWMAKDAALCE